MCTSGYARLQDQPACTMKSLDTPFVYENQQRTRVVHKLFSRILGDKTRCQRQTAIVYEAINRRTTKSVHGAIVESLKGAEAFPGKLRSKSCPTLGKDFQLFI